MSNNWPIVSLGEILKPISRPEPVQAQKTYDILGAHWYAKGLYTKAVLNGLEIKASKVYRVEKNDFVYNRLFGWKGSFAVATDKNHNCYVSNEFPCFLVNQERLDKQYLWYYFSRESAWLEALGLSSGGTPTSRNRLKENKLLAMKIPLPPLDEQRRIVARIETLAAKVEQAQRLRRQAVGEVEALKLAAFKKVRDSLLQDGLEKKTVGEITTVTSGGTPSRRNPTYWDDGNVPWIKTGELLDGDIYDAEEHITDEGLRNSSAKLFPRNTILVALYGQGQTRGRTGRLMIEAATNQACCAILPTDKLEPRFTQYWLQSLYSEMREVAHGGAQPNWNGKMIKDIEI